MTTTYRPHSFTRRHTKDYNTKSNYDMFLVNMAEVMAEKEAVSTTTAIQDTIEVLLLTTSTIPVVRRHDQKLCKVHALSINSLLCEVHVEVHVHHCLHKLSWSRLKLNSKPYLLARSTTAMRT